MDYIDKGTGEVFDVVTTNLANLCDGDLDFAFRAELKKLVDAMNVFDKGAINISVRLEKTSTPGGDICIKVETQVSTKYPKIGLKDDNSKRIMSDGKVVQRSQHNMFDNPNIEK